ncbi:MAG: hypothetical protein MK209_02445 [Planctomycetes bacterium]|nr:hypothetical protein [Planctomycetota bacterium]
MTLSNVLQTPHFLLALVFVAAAALAAPAQEAEPPDPTHEFDSQGVTWGQWWLLGPFEHEVGTTSVVPDQKVEREFKKMKAGKPFGELDQDYRGKGKSTIIWTRYGTPRLDQPDLGLIDFNLAVPAPTGIDNWNSNAVAYLYREVSALRPVEVEIMCGSDDGIRAWVNGELKLSRNSARGVNVRDERIKLKLKEGINHLVFKVNNGGGAWGFQMARYAHIKQERINAAIDTGAQWLLKRQLIDGSWGEEHTHYRNGMTALAVFSLIKSGIPARHPAILEALAFLSESPTTMTYSAGCHLMALEALKNEEYHPWMDEILGDLLSWQNRQGVWGYPDGHPDLSCTQFAALGLRAAAQAGLKVPDRAWVDLAEGTMDYQLKRARVDTSNALAEAYGNKISIAGYSYRDVHPMSARGSMTTAGIATLAICLEQLGERCPSKLRGAIERQIEDGMNWMTVHWSVSANPAVGSGWLHYYLYGLERVGGMLETEMVGPHEWYWEGAEFLCNQQISQGNSVGAWPDPYGRSESATCFSLLFLRRATQVAFTDPHGGGTKKVVKSEAKAAPVQVAAMSSSPTSFWINRIDLAALANRKIVAVDYFGRVPNGKWEMIASREAPKEHNPRERFAGRYTFAAAGTYEIYAIAYLEDEIEIKTGIAVIQVEESTEAGIRSYPRDAAKNLMPGGQPQVKTSSGSGHQLVDNKMVTSWLCAGNDATPTIELDLRRPVTADKILFTHARTRPIQQNNNPRATKVRVWIDFDDPIDVALDSDYRTKSIVRLPEARSIRKLEIQILEAVGGQVGKASLGFSEIELQGTRKRRGRR